MKLIQNVLLVVLGAIIGYYLNVQANKELLRDLKAEFLKLQELYKNNG